MTAPTIVRNVSIIQKKKTKNQKRGREKHKNAAQPVRYLRFPSHVDKRNNLPKRFDSSFCTLSCLSFLLSIYKTAEIFALRDVILYGIIISDVERFFIDLYCDIYEAVFFKTFSKKNEKFVFGGCINYSFV